MVTDGELRRYAFFGHLIDALDGFDKLGGWAIPFHNEHGERLVFKRPVVVEKLRWRRSMCAEELVYLRARTMRPTKVTLISSQQAAAYYDPDKSARRLSRLATPTWPTSWISPGGRSRSWSRSAAPTSRSTRPSTRPCSIPSSARATGSAAAIRTG